LDIRTQSSLLAAIVSVALAVSMLLRPGRTKAAKLFAVLCFTLAAWYLGDFLHLATSHGFWRRVVVATGGAVPAGVLAFFLEFLGVAKRSARRARTATLLGALFGLIVAVTPLARVPLARLLVALWVFGALGVSLSLLYRRMRASAARIERARIAYLFVGALLALVASILDFVPRMGLPLPPLGAMVTALYLFFLTQTLIRHRLLDLHELLGKFAALSVLALILAAVYGTLVIWSGDKPALFLFNTLVASFVILNLFEPLRAKVEEWVVAALFRERFELIRVLTALKARLFSVIDPHLLARVVLDHLQESRRVTHASIYLLADSRPGFSLLDFRGPSPVPFLDATAARSLLASAASGQKAVLLENVERRAAELARIVGPPGRPVARGQRDPELAKLHEEATRLAELRSALAAMHAGISIPLQDGERVLGFLNLWDERVPEAYSSDEIALMLDIADRAAMIIENSKLFERMKERDRLAALGEMAAGLAHEIRNPLGAIKGASQFLTSGREGEDEWLQVIVEEVDRLNGVVTQFLDYSRPLKSALAPTDVNDVLERTAKLVRAELPERVELVLEPGPRLPRVQTDAEQLKQVLINLFRNAVQAMPGGGKIVVSTAIADEGLRLHRPPETVEIHVRDSGPGIPEEHRENIFVPFFTTKEKGTGLGLAICQRLIRHHGGSISLLASAPGEGAEFVIRLPAVVEETPLPATVPASGSPAVRAAKA
jgi:two-component system sensor histidine kinase HydH